MMKKEKLNTGEDWVPVEYITKRTAIVKGISLNIEIGLGDMVLYDNNKRITQVVKKETNTVYINFKQHVYQAQTFKKIKKYFNDQGLEVEELAHETAGIAIPTSLLPEDFEIIFYNCPVDCSLIKVDEYQDTDDNIGLEDEDDDE